MGIKQLEVQLGASVLLGCQAIMFEISHKFQSAHCASNSARWAALEIRMRALRQTKLPLQKSSHRSSEKFTEKVSSTRQEKKGAD